ncbi:hypothetical protein QCA50_006432 [Cerrena zonata]|uniref:Epoxide hydrolase N-terminal domain-containing protein n=1 Tax=Cerrena zonata TaxID=2478898 RepID=A0AAW0GHS0_9APHY
MAEQPFTLAVPDADIEFLRKKLAVSRIPDELEDAKWDYGSPLEDVKRLVARWQDGFDWRKSEAEINAIPQFTRDIEVDGFGTLNIHYVHQKSTVVDAIPLLFVHGWPGHFMEVAKLLPLLTANSPDHPSFHVVAYSLPGFGFSETPKKKGFGITQYAEVGHKLMLALGYNEYVTQGGDWGMLITRAISNNYGGKHAKAWHTNFPITQGPPSPLKFPWLFLKFLVTPWSTEECSSLARTQEFAKTGRGYFMQQSTCPQTLGYSLADSPVGLLAWIYEKLVAWTDNYPWTDDEVLTWISIYWFSRPGPAASVRIYYEAEHVLDWDDKRRVPVPTGFSYFPGELVRLPNLWSETLGKVVFQSEHKEGGHFAAFEKPEALAGDLRKMFGKEGPAFAVVPGKTGY